MRELFLNQGHLGKWEMTVRIGVDAGHVINTALRGYVRHTSLDTDDTRSTPQRLANAEADIHQFWLDHNTGTRNSTGGGQGRPSLR